MKPWYLLSLILSCLIVRNYQSESPSERSDRNRFFEIELALRKAIELYSVEGSECYQVAGSFEAMADALDVALIWDERIIEHDGIYRLGQTNGDTIWIFTPMCHEKTEDVFFHEVGHVLLHYDGIIRPDQQEEDEANLFSVEIRKRLSLDDSNHKAGTTFNLSKCNHDPLY